MKTNYSAVSDPAEKSIEKMFKTPYTDLKDKGNFVLSFKYGPKKDSLYCPLDDFRIIHAEKIGTRWTAKITFEGDLCKVGKTKRPLIASGLNWAEAVCRLLALPQFFHQASYSWLAWYDLCANKPFLVHPKSNNKPPQKCNLFHPTQAWLDALCKVQQEKKTVFQPAKKLPQPVKQHVSQGKKVSQQLRGIGLTREESELPAEQKNEILMRRILA